MQFSQNFHHYYNISSNTQDNLMEHLKNVLDEIINTRN